jgi:hypothetical protein
MSQVDVQLFPEEIPAGAGAARLRRVLFEMEQRGREPRSGRATTVRRRATAQARVSRPRVKTA